MMYMNLQIVLNTQNSPYLNRAAQKNTCQNFSTQTNPEIENFKIKKSFYHPCQLKSGGPSPPPPPPLFASLGLKRASQHLRICNCILNVLESDSR